MNWTGDSALTWGSTTQIKDSLSIDKISSSENFSSEFLLVDSLLALEQRVINRSPPAPKLFLRDALLHLPLLFLFRESYPFYAAR